MGETAAILFDTDRGQTHPITDAGLLDRFAGAHNDERPLIMVNNANTVITGAEGSNTQSEGEQDSLINDPYAMTTRKLFYEKLEHGKWGEAIDMLGERLKNADEGYARELLTEFRDKFQEMGLNDAANELTSILAFSDLGMGFDFFNTSENSTGDVAEPDVAINRYKIEQHFDWERLKPPQHVQPFLGVSYG